MNSTRLLSLGLIQFVASVHHCTTYAKSFHSTYIWCYTLLFFPRVPHFSNSMVVIASFRCICQLYVHHFHVFYIFVVSVRQSQSSTNLIFSKHRFCRSSPLFLWTEINLIGESSRHVSRSNLIECLSMSK